MKSSMPMMLSINVSVGQQLITAIARTTLLAPPHHSRIPSRGLEREGAAAIIRTISQERRKGAEKVRRARRRTRGRAKAARPMPTKERKGKVIDHRGTLMRKHGRNVIGSTWANAFAKFATTPTTFIPPQRWPRRKRKEHLVGVTSQTHVAVQHLNLGTDGDPRGRLQIDAKTGALAKAVLDPGKVAEEAEAVKDQEKGNLGPEIRTRARVRQLVPLLKHPLSTSNPYTAICSLLKDIALVTPKRGVAASSLI